MHGPIAPKARRVAEERNRVEGALGEADVARLVEETHARLTDAIVRDDESWKREIPGKQVFNIFASKANLGTPRLKTLYIREVEERKLGTFDDITSIFEGFRRIT